MAKLKRKYLSEFCVNLYSGHWLLIPSSQITAEGEMRQEEAEIAKSCHIYLICERPAVSFDKNDFNYDGTKISGSLAYRIDGIENKEKFEQEFPLLDGAVDLRLSNYPHRQVETIDAVGGVVRYLPANALSVLHDPYATDHIFRKLKVLYVGQAFGGGNRSALDRLRSHSTLQKILAEASYKSPDSEIMVLTVQYEPYRVISSFDGREKEAISDGRDHARFISIIDNPLKLGQQISLTEAALIRYFQPEYNKIYKKKFPSRELKVLEQCYEYDFSALVVELNTDEFNFSTYSDVVPPKMHHSSRINLVDHEQRAGFFHTSDGKGGHREMSKSIGSRDG